MDVMRSRMWRVVLPGGRAGHLSSTQTQRQTDTQDKGEHLSNMAKQSAHLTMERQSLVVGWVYCGVGWLVPLGHPKGVTPSDSKSVYSCSMPNHGSYTTATHDNHIGKRHIR